MLGNLFDDLFNVLQFCTVKEDKDGVSKTISDYVTANFEYRRSFCWVVRLPIALTRSLDLNPSSYGGRPTWENWQSTSREIMQCRVMLSPQDTPPLSLVLFLGPKKSNNNYNREFRMELWLRGRCILKFSFDIK